MKKRNLTSLSDFIDEKVGPKGSKKREKYDNEFEAFKLGVLIQQARQEKDFKDIRFSTLQRIIKDGLGGQLHISIKV